MKHHQRGFKWSTTETIIFLQATTRFDKQLFFNKHTFRFFRLITQTTGERQGRTTLNNWMTSWMPRRKDCEKQCVNYNKVVVPKKGSRKGIEKKDGVIINYHGH